MSNIKLLNAHTGEHLEVLEVPSLFELWRYWRTRYRMLARENEQRRIHALSYLPRENCTGTLISYIWPGISVARNELEEVYASLHNAQSAARSFFQAETGTRFPENLNEEQENLYATEIRIFKRLQQLTRIFRAHMQDLSDVVNTFLTDEQIAYADGINGGKFFIFNENSGQAEEVSEEVFRRTLGDDAEEMLKDKDIPF